MVIAAAAEGLGLTSAQAASRLAADGPNELPTAKPRSLLRQALDVLRQPMLLLLLGAGIVNFALSEPLDGAILLSFVNVVIGISIYQEHKTERALTALRDLSSPRALVRRDGVTVRIPGREVVAGDVVLLAEGDRVPADGVLFDSAALAVDESALTGESVPVRKSPTPPPDAGAVPAIGAPGGDDTPWVFSGTLVVRGHGAAVVGATGVRTELGRIGAALASIEEEPTRLQREIDRIVRVVAVVGLAAAVAVVAVYGLARGGWLDGVLAGIGTAMAMLPEEFPVVLTVFLALGAWRLSQREVLTRRAPVIETLGSVTVLCVDKTGTLTMNEMTISEVVLDGQVHEVDDAGLPEHLHEIVELGMLASPVSAFDPMDRAFRSLGEERLSGTEHVHPDWELVREYPLSDHLLALCHVWRSPDSSRYVVAAKGAPEAIADLCHLDPDRAARIHAQVEEAARRGRRVLGVARARFDATVDLPTEPHDFEFEMVGLVGLHDPVRPGVRDAVRECERAGVRTVMITGDHPATALSIAEEVGLDGATGCITGPELTSMPDDELVERARSVSVFARMVPDQKLRLVRALAADGQVVGMTGDGVNDAPALRAAHIGIAMGGRGTDVAREAAALVIVDDDFASIVNGVRLGRAVFDNLRKAMAYIVAVHVVIVGMSLFPLFTDHWPLVLLPVQIAFLELIIDPACSVVFEAEQADPRLMDQSPRRVGEAILGRRVLTISVLQGLSVLAAVIAVYLWALTGERSDAEVRSLAFITLVVANLLLIVVNRSWRLTVWQTVRQRRNRTLRWMLTLAPLLLVALLTVPIARRAFSLAPVTLVESLVSVAAAFAGVTWFEVYKLLGNGRGRTFTGGSSPQSPSFSGGNGE